MRSASSQAAGFWRSGTHTSPVWPSDETASVVTTKSSSAGGSVTLGLPRAESLLYNGQLRRSPFRGHRFPADVIRHAVWLYLGFTLSFRDAGDLLAERGLDISCETIRRRVAKSVHSSRERR